ncbi:MAG: metallophosphoesterase [Myxococcota bacterium]|nr:metallophosphoesterase [Myxococcota bacterium]
MTFRTLVGLAVALSLAACEPTEVVPPGDDAGADDGGDPHMGLRLPRCEDTDPAPATPLPHVASTLVSTLVPRVDRQAAAGARNPAIELGETMYRALDYHLVDVGPGQPHVRRTDLGEGSSTSVDRRSIAWFAHLSDFQLVDDESPTRLARIDNAAIPGGLRAQEAYLPRAVSAMSRTFARVERAEREYDFGIVTGDCADSAQQNELEWVIALMNGEPGLHTDSGDDDDPVPGPANDPKDPFDPTAFPAPWLFVPGNHDVEVVGITVPTDRLRETALGTTAPSGTRDYTRWYATVSNGPIVADPNRAIIDRDDIVSTLRAAESTGPEGPPGHGYPETGAIDTTLGANWAYDAIPGLLRVLALDTSDLTGGSDGMVRRPTIEGWLLPELDRAVADGVLVILSSHHSTTSIDRIQGQLGSTEVEDALSAEELETLVASRAEVIAWLVGHTHDNRVRAIPGPDAEHPGYWEIMTSAIADYPAQARTIELVDNADGTLSIFATVLDYDTDDCFERRFRALMQMEWVSAWVDDVSRDPEDGNVELIRAVPASAADAVAAASATGAERIESTTTLLGM